MTSTPFITCTQCGREASALFRCPERKNGACPFVKRWSRRNWKILAILMVAGVIAGLEYKSWWLPVGAAAIGLVLSWTSGETQLHHAGRGLVLERTTFAGYEWRLESKTKCQELAVCGAPSRAIRYPLSIIMLLGPCRIGTEDHRAACILRAALIDLQLKQLIELHMLRCADPHTTETEATHGTECYVARAARDPAGTLELGDIEQGLLKAVEYSAPAPAARDGWLEGPRLYELIRTYFGKDRADPAGDVRRSAEKDASRRGLLLVPASHSLWRPRQAEWEEGRAAELQADCQASEEVLGLFAKTYSDLWSNMEAQIREAIQSRVDSSD